MENFSPTAKIGKKFETGTTNEASKAARLICERLPSMRDEHLVELESAISLAVGSLDGNADKRIALERGVRTSALFLAGGAIASGMYALLPVLLAAAFPDAIPGLKSPSAARAEKRALAVNILDAIGNERDRRRRVAGRP